MKKNIARVVVKPDLKNDLAIIKNHLTTINIKTKWNFQKKHGILSQQIMTKKMLGKSCKSCNTKTEPLIK